METTRHPYRILIIEDDSDVRDLVADILDSEGYLVGCAAHGREALDLLRRSPPPDLILLDLKMPVMDGREFRKHQCRDPALASIPVVIVSAEADVRHVSQCLGVRDCLAKPMNVDGLLTVVARYCP
jgi:CheY-like chemotaxis protein